ncbi:XdhC family protein [Thiohalomonas denitrificans]|uniref:Xanthine dehydrogenase accessory factor n=1 Tax=Thiohalomonas denitrificans TaxID=415747 RepID=A0A1G5PUY0_9GAMM|nr:XdhC family protein [Thiohalomonas denitrificans]SCZ53050.1 xanthine dehydrogenase accessory factor [Thiohalomonas denitrificans]
MNVGGDQEVLERAAAWLEAGTSVWLVTVAATWGSSPRPPGSLMALTEGGLSVGSVSGGCLEADLTQRLGKPEGTPQRLQYGVSSEEAHRFGLPCGGRVEVIAEPLQDAAAIIPALAACCERRRVYRQLDLRSGVVTWRPAERESVPLSVGEARLGKLFGPTWRLLIIGDGQLSRRVAEMAAALDYEVIICDPRVEAPEEWDCAAARLETRMPDDTVLALADDPRSAVVALTHDPKLDDMALMEALGCKAFYVGALGSRRNSAGRRERLAELGLTTRQLNRLSGPIGLPLGGRSPAEIAVSIVAELTAVKYGVSLGQRPDTLLSTHSADTHRRGVEV